MILQTERLILRRWKESDIEPFAKITADPEVRRYYPSVLTLDQTKALVERIEAGFEKESFGLWAVELIEIGELIGYVGLSRPTFEAAFMPCIEIGWQISRQHWGRGYAPEAALRVLEDGFTRLNLDEIVSFTTENNLPSRRVMEKIGMQYDPQNDYLHPFLPDGHPLKPHVLYRLPRAIWLSRQRV